MIGRFLLAVLLLLGAGAAHADELRPGFVDLRETAVGEWTLLWKIPLRGGPVPDAAPLLPPQCRALTTASRQTDGTMLTSSLQMRCSSDISGERVGLPALARAQTDMLMRVQPLGRAVQVHRLTPETPAAVITARADRGQVARTYFLTGIDHILFGFDHLLFVIALVLLLTGFWTIAAAVTAFTIAHSVTLVGTTLGVMGLPQRPVEAVIALSILFLAVEIVKRDPAAPRLSERRPWAVAFAFGLLHGFGFAGALNEIGLPEDDVPLALFTFNLGVEAGQLAVVAITMLAVAALRRFAPEQGPTLLRAAAYGIGAIAAYWLIDRLV